MDKSPEHPSRRQFLSRSASTAGLASLISVGSLAGCTGRGEEAATPTPDGPRLETLEVGASPGESVPVEPAREAALLDFFATWCAPCKPQMEELSVVREEFPDLHMLSLTREDDTELVADFWREYEGAWPVAQDPELEAFQEYDVTRIPTLLVLDAEGSEVWRHSGLSAAGDIIDRVNDARA
ncbi:MAG: redoxin family protein [Haloarculaceae archaeon]